MLPALLALALLAPAAAQAQDANEDGKPDRVRSVVLYGDEQCPKPSDPNEVVVCAHGDDSLYRIPSELRQPTERPDSTSWAVRADDVMQFSRAGLPNSCSTIGSGGQTGCTLQMLQQWRTERRELQRRDAIIP